MATGKAKMCTDTKAWARITLAVIADTKAYPPGSACSSSKMNVDSETTASVAHTRIMPNSTVSRQEAK